MKNTLSKFAFLLVAAVGFGGVQTSLGAAFTVDTVSASTSDDSVTINNAIFQKYVAGGAGAGNFTNFLGLDRNPPGTAPVRGYNYDGGGARFDQTNPGGTFVPHLELASIPVVVIDGQQYLQFVYDSANVQTMLDFRVYVQADPGNTNQAIDIGTTPPGPETVGTLGSLGTLVYQLGDNTLSMTMASGFGQADLSFNIPVSAFSGMSGTDNVYVWASFSASGSKHEFATNKATGIPTFSSLVPEPATGLGGLLMLALAGSARFRGRTRH